MDESDLIRKAQEGDETAIADLFRMHESNLRGVAFNILHNEEDAEEIASDAFTKGIKTFDPGRAVKLSTWLHRITRNACISKLRKLKPEDKLVSLSADESLEQFIDEKTVVEWLPDEDGTLSYQNVEDFHRTLELTRKKEEYEKEGVNLLEDFLKRPIPGQSFHDWYEDDGSWWVLLTWGDHWHLLTRDKSHDPSETDKIRTLLEGIPKKTIAKKEGKSMGAVYAVTHKIRKKIRK